ncbi:MAG: hypothetical protein ABIP38_06195 [Steroidobacteraceae bacterium]
MKRLAYVPIAVLLLSLSYFSFSADSPSRPVGVTAENWVPVSDRLGLVLVQGEALVAAPVVVAPGQLPGSANRPDMALLLKPPVRGYFMVKGAGGWTRLVVIEPIKGPADAG